MSDFVKLQTAICALAFIFLGIAGVMPGATLPELARAMNVPLESAGIIFTMSQIGILLAALGAGRLLDVTSQRVVLAVGNVIIALGLAAMAFCSDLTGGLVTNFLFGFGYGVAALAPNVIITNMYRERSGEALNIINVFYGVGAIAGPMLTGLSIDRLGNFRYAYWLGAGLLLILSVVALFVHFPALEKRTEEGQSRVPWGALLFLLIIFFCLEMALESGFGSWAVTYMLQGPGLSIFTASMAFSVYWMAMTVARMLGAWLLRRLSDFQVISICVAVAGTGLSLLLLAGEGVVPNMLAVIVIGLGTGPLFPTGLSFANRTHPGLAGTLTGLLLGIGTIGGMTMPWLQGKVFGMAGPGWGMSLLLLLALLMLAVLWVIGSHLPGRRASLDQPACEKG